jgi:hypothetical protein
MGRSWAGGSLSLGGKAGEVFRDFNPVIDADESGCGEVMGRTVEDSPPFEAKKILGLVVNEEVGTKNAFVSAEDVMCRRDEGKVALQPTILGSERVGNGHGLRRDEDFETRREIFENGLRIGHERQVFEEVFGVEEGAKLGLAIERSDLPQAFAHEVFGSDGFIKGLVVAADVFEERVGHDLVHIDTDALHVRLS